MKLPREIRHNTEASGHTNALLVLNAQSTVKAASWCSVRPLYLLLLLLTPPFDTAIQDTHIFFTFKETSESSFSAASRTMEMVRDDPCKSHLSTCILHRARYQHDLAEKLAYRLLYEFKLLLRVPARIVASSQPRIGVPGVVPRLAKTDFEKICSSLHFIV